MTAVSVCVLDLSYQFDRSKFGSEVLVKRTLFVLMMVCLGAFLSVGMVGCGSGGGEEAATPSDQTEDGTQILTPEEEEAERAYGEEE